MLFHTKKYKFHLFLSFLSTNQDKMVLLFMKEGWIMSNNIERIRDSRLHDRIVSAEEAAAWIQDGMTLGLSGFTKAGDAKAIPYALVERAKTESFKVNGLKVIEVVTNREENVRYHRNLQKNVSQEINFVLAGE